MTGRVLLDAMVEHLASGSPADLTMRAVARRAGVAERTIFRHFASRDELLDALAMQVSLRLCHRRRTPSRRWPWRRRRSTAPMRRMRG